MRLRGPATAQRRAFDLRIPGRENFAKRVKERRIENFGRISKIIEAYSPVPVLKK